ncbi:hypothetical protein D9V41_03610 [Aeromicrobium phragmitis]|uniref:ParA family protein n=1 Tax=Aeromicrobium phragmitis TaxID=2478914 RepID=A0A3L8PNI6_9ACTN|nr:hypothetical protein [Aeromicrobium phragmitis]RLV56870.1 hypothetical protein D9V41_03610 [Aeromicrobium phragmitis]
MSLVSFVSAKGAPGVTTTVTTLAGLWPQRPVVVELDPQGSDIELRQRAADGSTLGDDRGLLSLAAAARVGQEVNIDDHVQITDAGLDVCLGVTTPAQMQGLATTWSAVGTALRAAGRDVLADCGRFATGMPAMPVVERSTALVFVARDSIEGLAHLRNRLAMLEESRHSGGLGTVKLGYVLVGDPTDTRSAADTERLFASAGLRAELLGVIAFDPRTVGRLRTDSERRIRRSLYIRSAQVVADKLARFVGTVPQASSEQGVA